MTYTQIIFGIFFFIFHTQTFLSSEAQNTVEQKIHYKISVIGTGYVGLITGAILAEFGHTVICTDINKKKIEKLNQGRLPFFEPDLQEFIQKNNSKKRLLFAHNIGKAIEKSEVIFICVGTPLIKDTNHVDLQYLDLCIKKLAKHINNHKIIVIKSTVPVGTHDRVKQILEKNTPDESFDLVSNPEFLREGTGISDFLNLNPLVIGSNNKKAKDTMRQIYSPLIKKETPVFFTNPTTAEVVKYLWNSFCALRISFVNELSNFCQKNNVDIFKAIEIMGLSEKALPTRNICPGPGIGGSCLEKDVKTLVNLTKGKDLNFPILTATLQSNNLQKETVVKNIYSLLDNSIEQKTICILGLSYKKNTDDVRESPSIFIIDKLLKGKAHIKAYDPKAMENMRLIYPEISYVNNSYEAIQGSDLVVVLTNWDEFKIIDLKYAKTLMHQPNLFDTKNIWNPRILKQLNFNYLNLGRVE